MVNKNILERSFSNVSRIYIILLDVQLTLILGTGIRGNGNYNNNNKNNNNIILHTPNNTSNEVKGSYLYRNFPCMLHSEGHQNMLSVYYL